MRLPRALALVVVLAAPGLVAACGPSSVAARSSQAQTSAAEAASALSDPARWASSPPLGGASAVVLARRVVENTVRADAAALERS